LPCFSVPKGEAPKIELIHMSTPPRMTPPIVPNFDQSGLTLRTGQRSLPMALERQLSS